MTQSLHSYLAPLLEDESNPEFILAIQRNVKDLWNRDLPPLLSLKHISIFTGVPYTYLLEIVNRKKDPYRVFSIKKRSGGVRFICVPEPKLKKVQKWIYEKILLSEFSKSLITDIATAYIRGRGFIFNAQRHASSSFLLKYDLTDFFESISERQVYRVFRRFGYRSQVAFYLTRLCTRVLFKKHFYWKSSRWKNKKRYLYHNYFLLGHLPQGSSTSPMLANLVCSEMDRKLSQVADFCNLVVTRYADDIVFSSLIGLSSNVQFDDFSKRISKLVSIYGFSLNKEKTRIRGKGSRKIVTGLCVNNRELRIPRKYKNKVKQELYFLEKFGLDDCCLKLNIKNPYGYLIHLKGKIQYISTIEKNIGNRFSKQFSELFPQLENLQNLQNLIEETSDSDHIKT